MHREEHPWLLQGAGSNGSFLLSSELTGLSLIFQNDYKALCHHWPI